MWRRVVILCDFFTSREIEAPLKDVTEIKQSLIDGLVTEKGFNSVKFERVECSNVCCWFMQSCMLEYDCRNGKNYVIMM